MVGGRTGVFVDNPYRTPDAELSPVEAEYPPGGDVLDQWIPASNWNRLGGYLIDGFVVFGIVLVLGFALGIALELGGGGAAQFDDVPDQVFGMVMMVPVALFFGFLEGSGLQASLGKKALGMRVVTLSGEELDLATAMKRNFVKWLGLGICGLLAFTVLGGEGSSAWDKVAGTRVVKRNPYI